ncbi:MAG: cbb3-type cytochrome c oxidase subunit I [Candidatus Dormibacter sp.]
MKPIAVSAVAWSSGRRAHVPELSAETNPSFTSAESYLTVVGLHSVIMIFIASAATIGPFGNYLLPIMTGSRGMAFPRLEALTFWLLTPAALILLSSIFLGGFPIGWIGYAPLADEAARGMDTYLVAFSLIGRFICLFPG